MFKWNVRIIWVIALLSLSQHLQANEHDPEAPAFCKNPDQAKELKKVFPDAYAQAVRIHATVCRNLDREAKAQSKVLMLEVVDLIGTLDKVFGNNVVSKALIEPEQKIVTKSGRLSTFELLRDTDDLIVLSMNGDNEISARINKNAKRFLPVLRI